MRIALLLLLFRSNEVAQKMFLGFPLDCGEGSIMSPTDCQLID
jgi:hypothetical protein